MIRDLKFRKFHASRQKKINLKHIMFKLKKKEAGKTVVRFSF